MQRKDSRQPVEDNIQGREKDFLSAGKRKDSLSATCCLLSTDKGIALVMALVISLAVSLLIISTVYFIIQSTNMSGAGKRYATASEAADGAVEVMKDAVNLILMGESVSSLPIVDASTPCLLNSIFNENESCTITLALPGSGLFTRYSANITVMRLYSSSLPGSRLEFAKSENGGPTTAIYFRINTVVTGPVGTRAETTALYRHVQ
jgi:hypothetical protein